MTETKKKVFDKGADHAVSCYLQENRADRFLAMFLSAIYSSTDLAPIQTPTGKEMDIKRWIGTHVRWTMKNMVKDDRVVWWLTHVTKRQAIYYVASEIFRLAQEIDEDNAIEAAKTLPIYKAYMKEATKWSKKVKEPLVQPDVAGSDTAVPLTDMSKIPAELHNFIIRMIGFDMPEMDHYVFELDGDPSELHSELSAIETRFREKEAEKRRLAGLEGGFKISGQDEIAVELDGGWHWALCAESPECSADETAVMMHCGNDYTFAQPTDLFFSLRQPTKKPEVMIPHLSFIVNKGVLKEAKGVRNVHPSETYHKYILPLLLSDHITAVNVDQPGCHAAANNFRLRDLAPELLDQVADKFGIRPSGEDLITQAAHRGGWSDGSFYGAWKVNLKRGKRPVYIFDLRAKRQATHHRGPVGSAYLDDADDSWISVTVRAHQNKLNFIVNATDTEGQPHQLNQSFKMPEDHEEVLDTVRNLLADLPGAVSGGDTDSDIRAVLNGIGNTPDA